VECVKPGGQIAEPNVKLARGAVLAAISRARPPPAAITTQVSPRTARAMAERARAASKPSIAIE